MRHHGLKMRSQFVLFEAIFVLVATLLDPVISDAVAERSVLDSGYSRTAAYLMQTAMKLPPHILPTLDEIATTPESPIKQYSEAIGVYVPGHKDIGIYFPKPKENDEHRNALTVSIPEKAETKDKVQVDLLSETFEEQTRSSQKPRPKRHRRRRRYRKKKRRQFKPNLSSRLRPRLRHSTRSRRPNEIVLTPNLASTNRNKELKMRGHKSKTKEFKTESNEHPYQFAKPDFSLPPIEDVFEFADQPHGSAGGNEMVQQTGKGNARIQYPFFGKKQKAPPPPTLPPAPHVPTFIKEMLAKAFLKDPQAYLKQLRQQQEAKEKQNRLAKAKLKSQDVQMHGPQRRRRPIKAISQSEGRPQRRPPDQGIKEQQDYYEYGYENNDYYYDQEDVDENDVYYYSDDDGRRTSQFERSKGLLSTRYPVPKKEFLQPWQDPTLTTTTTMSTTTTPPPAVDFIKDAFASASPFGDYDYYDYSQSNFLGDHYYHKGRNKINEQAKRIANLREEHLEGSPRVTHHDPYAWTPALPPTTPAPKVKVTTENIITRRNTICICCDESSSENHFRNHAYNRRMLKVEDESELNRLLSERALIEEEVDCSKQEPIEVVLVFEGPSGKAIPSSSSRHENAAVRAAQKALPNNFLLTPSFDYDPDFKPSSFYSDVDVNEVSQSQTTSPVYYDPTKLSFIFSTPSPITKRFLELRDREALARWREEESLKRTSKKAYMKNQTT